MPNTSIIKIKEVSSENDVYSLWVSFVDVNGMESEPGTKKYDNSFFSETDRLLDWHFEEYITAPYDSNPYARSLGAIERYGKTLFKSLITEDIAFQYKKAFAENGPENILIEVTGDSPVFHSIYWEALWDEKHTYPLAVQGVSFIRRNTMPSAVSASVNPSSTINLLIVTARPGEDEDVNYRTIQRPLIDLIQRTETPVKPHILRPGTYESLIKHLDGKSGYYHIIHFDLHGGLLDYPSYNSFREYLEKNPVTGDGSGVEYGLKKLYPGHFGDGKKTFLFFESNQKGVPVPVEGEQLAIMLENHKIPICILNACQSAKQEGSEHETSLGRILSKKGLQAVIAMRYSISVTAAEIIMKELYRQLYNGELIDKAITNCRKELYRSKKRHAGFNYEIELEDWLLPVIYINSNPVLKTIPMTAEDEHELFQRNKVQEELDGELRYGFFGRDLEIQQMEKIIEVRSKIFLLQGMGGAGKTTLLRYSAGWWLRTGFIEKEFYFGYDLKAYNLKEIVWTIAARLYSRQELDSFTELDFELQKNRIVTKLRANKYLLVLDNTESISGERLAIPNTLTGDEQQELKRFLARLKGGDSAVIIGSRADERWLKAGTFEHHTYILGGLDKESAGNFAQKIMVDNNVNIHHAIGDKDFSRLMNLLAGYPLALKAVLPNLERKSAGKILSELMEGLAGLDDGNIQSKTESIIKCIEYSHSNLSEETQSILLCLAPFQSFLDMRPEVITLYFNEIKTNLGLSVPGGDKINEIVIAAERAGLMQRITQENFMVLQPVFTYFLRNKLSAKGSEFHKNMQKALVQHYQNISFSLYEKIIHPDLSINSGAFELMRLEYENYYNVLNLLLTWGEFTMLIFSVLEEYLDRTGQHQKRLELAEMVNRKLEYKSFQL